MRLSKDICKKCMDNETNKLKDTDGWQTYDRGSFYSFEFADLYWRRGSVNCPDGEERSTRAKPEDCLYLMEHMVMDQERREK